MIRAKKETKERRKQRKKKKSTETQRHRQKRQRQKRQRQTVWMASERGGKRTHKLPGGNISKIQEKELEQIMVS
jgi:hypothetical protein